MISAPFSWDLFRSCCHQQELHLQHLEFTPLLPDYPLPVQLLRYPHWEFSVSKTSHSLSLLSYLLPNSTLPHYPLSCLNELLQLGDHLQNASVPLSSTILSSQESLPFGQTLHNLASVCIWAVDSCTQPRQHDSFQTSLPHLWNDLLTARQPALPCIDSSGIISHLFISPQFSPHAHLTPLSANGVISNSIMKCLQSASISSFSAVPLTLWGQLNTSSPERPSLATLAKATSPLVTLSLWLPEFILCITISVPGTIHLIC